MAQIFKKLRTFDTSQSDSFGAIHCSFFAICYMLRAKKATFSIVNANKNAPRFKIHFQFKSKQFKFCVCLLLLSICILDKSIAQQPKDFTSIFNGKDFTGWTVEEKPANFSIADSAIVLKMTNKSTRHAFLRTNKQYKDFILEFDSKRDSNYDSGILLRGILMSKEAHIALKGYMIKIDPSSTRLWTGGVFMDFGNKSEWLYSLEDDKRAQQAEKVAQWNHYRVEAIGKNIKVWINGIPIVNLLDNRYDKGYIAFKIHRLKEITPKWNENMEARFKNIKIISVNPQRFVKEMDIAVRQNTTAWKQLFNGKNLTGFTKVGAEGKITVEDGNIVLYKTTNTLEHTFLRTNKTYKDFILELDAKRDPSFLYGILFRAINAPDTAHVRLYGYQVKIDHTKRAWTGGIFDDFGNTWNWMSNLMDNPIAQKAERPAGEWNHWRFEVIGDNISVWLNGIQTANLKNDKYKEGYIALKIHFLKSANPIANSNAWFKNIKIIDADLKKYSFKQ